MGFSGGSGHKESPCKAGNLDLIPELGRSPGGGHGNPLRCSCLENPMDRGAWQVTVRGSQRVLSICKQELYNNSVLFLLCNGMLPHYKLEVPYTTEKC